MAAAAAAILENQNLALSQQRLQGSSRNLPQWCLGCEFAFSKSKMANSGCFEKQFATV